jgi:hypothetical protein
MTKRKAQAIILVNHSADKYGVGNVQLLRELKTIQKAFEKNTKMVVPAGADLVNVMGEMTGVLPFEAQINGHPQDHKKAID